MPFMRSSVTGRRDGADVDPRIRTRSALTLLGVTDAALLRRRTTDGWQTLRPGHFIEASVAKTLTAEERHRLQIASAAAAFGEGSVFSHSSAAVLHEIALWGVPLNRVHITQDRAHGGRSSRTSMAHAARLVSSEIACITGYSVTTPARTVCDLARHHGFETGVVAADDALHRGLLDTAALAAAASAAQGLRGAAVARAVAHFADGRSESVGESRSRVALAASGIEPVDLQRVIVDRSGRPIARADFYFEGNVVGEFDGMSKYGRLLRPGQTAGDAVAAEKLREDRIRSTNRIVVRWTWRDLSSPETLARRVGEAIALGHRLGQPVTP